MADDEDPPRCVLHFGVPRYVTGYCRGKSSRVIGSDRSKERPSHKRSGGLSTDTHRFFHNELVDTPFAFAENCLGAFPWPLWIPPWFSRVFDIRDNAFDYSTNWNFWNVSQQFGLGRGIKGVNLAIRWIINEIVDRLWNNTVRATIRGCRIVSVR